MKDRTLLLLANGTRARFFEGTRGHAEWVELSDLVAPENRLRDRSVTTDRPGRSHGPGAQRHGVNPEGGQAEELVDHFARDTMAKLASTFDEQKHEHILLCAAPAFLGHLRRHVPGQLKGHIRHELDRDWTHVKAAEIEPALKHALEQAAVLTAPGIRRRAGVPARPAAPQSSVCVSGSDTPSRAPVAPIRARSPITPALPISGVSAPTAPTTSNSTPMTLLLIAT